MSYAERLYRKCPVCDTHALPQGKIVCCQNSDCLSIVNTETEEILGTFKGDGERYYTKPMRVWEEKDE